MADGYFGTRTCWPTALEARWEVLESQFPKIYNEGTRTVVHDAVCNSSAGSWWGIPAGSCGVWGFVYDANTSTTPSGVFLGTAVTQVVRSCTLPPTASEKFADGVTVGWLLVAVLAAVWKFKQMREQAK